MPLLTDDRAAAIEYLAALGIENGGRYLDEASREGMVEIARPAIR
jgi:hypothetical protein